MDLEQLGALLDARLPAEERAALLARLTRSEHDRAVFVDTAAVLHELEEEDAVPAAAARTPAPSPPARRPRRLAAWIVSGVAAGIALAVGLPMAMRSSELPPPETTHYALADRERGLPTAWPNAWGAVRGEGAVADPGATASRLGVAHLHLLLAAAANDSSAKARAITDAREVLRGEWALVAEEYQELAGPAVSSERIAETGELAAQTVDEGRFRLGAWAEAARLAAARRDPAFFRSSASRSALDSAARLSGLPAPAPAAIQELRRLAESPGPPDWPALEQASARLARAITS